MTLRAVGARVGVSRGAPYGHFDNKDHLLTAVAIDAWNALADDVERLIFLQQQDATQEPWRESWSSAAADPEAGELLEALRLALADLGAGDDAEPHLQALEDVIADAEDRAPDEA